jgi:cysteine sulfinate desulfinase/cysteine desulfurase-like protein
VLAAIGAIGSDEQAALRVSLGRQSDAATVAYAIGAVVDVVNTLRSVA